MSHLTVLDQHVPCTRAEIHPGSLRKYLLMPAKGRGAVFTSHLLIKLCACLEWATSSFQKGTVRTGGVPCLGLHVALASSEASSSLGRGHPAPFLLPDHLARPSNSLTGSSCIFPLPLPASSLPYSLLPPSQSHRDTCLHTEATFHLQVQKSCSLAHQELISSQHLSKCVWRMLIREWQGRGECQEKFCS